MLLKGYKLIHSSFFLLFYEKKHLLFIPTFFIADAGGRDDWCAANYKPACT